MKLFPQATSLLLFIFFVSFFLVKHDTFGSRKSDIEYTVTGTQTASDSFNAFNALPPSCREELIELHTLCIGNTVTSDCLPLPPPASAAGREEQEESAPGALRPSGWENQEIQQGQLAGGRAHVTRLRIQPGSSRPRPRYPPHPQPFFLFFF